jgi:DnaA family protein
MQFGVGQLLTFETFHPGGQPTLTSVSQGVVDGGADQQLYVWGTEGLGKTHLLSACCHYASDQGLRLAYVPAQLVREQSLTGLESVDLLCLDDVHLLPDAAEREVFNLYNQLRERGGRLIVSADVAPASLGVNLPDLRSRLSWGLVYQLKPLDDTQLLTALVQRARSMGLDLPQDVAEFILARHTRDLSTLVATLDELLQHAFEAKRRLTIPFVKSVLGY